jgi:hypothetical protein
MRRGNGKPELKSKAGCCRFSFVGPLYRNQDIQDSAALLPTPVALLLVPVPVDLTQHLESHTSAERQCLSA